MITRAFRQSFATTGALFTWGETTYGWARPSSPQLRVPGRVGSFTDVTQVATGQYHLLFLRQNQQLYGAGLGFARSDSEPVLVDQLRDVKVAAIAAGRNHSLALAQDGSLFEWGRNGLLDVLSMVPSQPTAVKSPEPFTHIAAGDRLSFAVGQSGKVYGWGRNLSVLGEQASTTPRPLDEVNYLLHSHHAQLRAIKSSGRNLFLLLDDGRLYVQGANTAGLFATRRNPKVVLDDFAAMPTKVIDEDFADQRIAEFEVSANSLIFRTEAGQVFYSGMETRFRPARFPLEHGPARSIFATYDSVGAVDAQGSLVFLNDAFIERSVKRGDVFVHRGLPNALQLGGTYQLRYALVSN